MFIGMGSPIPRVSNLPGSRAGGGSTGLETVDNDFSMTFSNVDESYMPASNLRDELMAGNNKKVSFSGWYNVSSIGVNMTMFGTGFSNHGPISIDTFGAYPRCRIKTSSGNSNIQGTSPEIIANQWQHFFLVIDLDDSVQTDTVKMYINGERITTVTGTFPTSGSSFDLSQNQPDVLINAWRTSPISVTATIVQYDEFAFWNTVVDEKTIKNIYEANSASGKAANLSTVYPSNLKAWYRMGDN